MNTRYEAIVSLGRSIEQMDEDGWTTNSLGCFTTPKCAVGHLSYALMQSTHFMAASSLSLSYPAECEAATVAYRALIETLSEQQFAELGECCEALDGNSNGASVSYDKVRAGTGIADDYECLVIIVNDELICDAAEAKRWFSDAIDVLAEDLPVPSGPLVEAVTDSTAELVVV